MISIEIQKGQRIETIDFDLLEVLTVVFVTMKLTGYVDWNWLFVLSPILLIILVTYVLMRK